MPYAIKACVGSGFAVRTQAPIRLGDNARPSEPQPDIVVVVGSWREYYRRKPSGRDIRLVVEVSDTSLKYDRKIKGRLYASAEIDEYWILNLADAKLEVYRDPRGGDYHSRNIFGVGDTVSPLFAPDARIAVASFIA